MIISKKEASKLLDISPGAISQWKDKPFFRIHDGKTQIDTDHPEFQKLMIQKQNKTADKKRSDSMTRRQAIKDAWKPEEEDPPPPKIADISAPMPEDVKDLAQQAAIAGFQDIIFTAKIREEKAKQEEIKTLEIKKDLAPIALVKYFFSFAESMIHRSYRRFHEITPELNALFLAGKIKEAEQMLIREQEIIVTECRSELIKAIQEEGFKIEPDK